MSQAFFRERGFTVGDQHYVYITDEEAISRDAMRQLLFRQGYSPADISQLQVLILELYLMLLLMVI